MSGNLDLLQSRNELLETMSEENQAKYWKLMQLWFQQKINKPTFDGEMIKILNKSQNELHKKFILIFLHKYLSYSKHKYLSYDFDEEMELERGAKRPNVNGNTCDGNASDYVDHINKKMKVMHDTEREYYFEPVDMHKFLSPIHAICDQDSQSSNKDSYLMGLLQVIAWQQGIQNGVPNTEVAALVQYSVNVFIKNILTTIVMKKKTFTVKGNNFLCDFGKNVPNPWLQSSHIYRSQQSPRYPLIRSSSYLSEKRSLMKHDSFHTAMDISNSVQFSLLKKEPNNSISAEDVLYVVKNNVNNIIPFKDLQYMMYEHILPIRNSE